MIRDIAYIPKQLLLTQMPIEKSNSFIICTIPNKKRKNHRLPSS